MIIYHLWSSIIHDHLPFMIIYHSWSSIIHAHPSFMIIYHLWSVIIQTSNDKNYYQNPTNLDESWSVGISITCSSSQTCSEACRRDPGQVQTSNVKNYSQNPTNLDESWSVGILITCSSSHIGSQASRSGSEEIFQMIYVKFYWRLRMFPESFWPSLSPCFETCSESMLQPSG